MEEHTMSQIDLSGVTIDLSGPIVLDLEQISDEPVAEGWHTITIERAEGRESGEGKPMIFALSRVTDESDPEYNRTVVWNNMLTGEGLRFTKRCFKGLGLPMQLDYPSVDALCADMVGRGCDVRVRHGKVRKGPRTGEIQANVSAWKATQFDSLMVDEPEDVPF